ncbi:MAG: TorF family putative porin [Gammaproteobacteria bacterium]|nr:TorF family putative porin [Gammaproteobacteria bacterium]
MMKKTLPLAMGLLLSAGAAQAELSANIGVTSDYVWRGVTQSDNGPAVQGGVDWSHDSGFYLGTWASNVKFGDDTGHELDLYGGYGGSVGEFGYDVGLLYYTYPSSWDANFLELGVSASYLMFNAGLNYTLASEVDDGAFTEGDLYYHAGLSFELPQDFSLGFTVGHYDFDYSGADDYTHYQVDLGKSAGDFGDFTLSLSQAEEEAGNPNGDDVIAFVSWSKSF